MYSPVEGGLPQNVLDEFRNISAAFARVEELIRSSLREFQGEIEFPPFPDFSESPAFDDINRAIRDLEIVFNERLAENQKRIEETRNRIIEIIEGFRDRYDDDFNGIEKIRQELIEIEKENTDIVARYYEEVRLRIGEDEALASKIELLEVSGTYDDSQLWAAVYNEELARINADEAFAGTIQLLGAVRNDNAAFILNEQTVYVTANESLAQRFTFIDAAVGDNTASIIQESTARATADNALSTSIQTLQTNVNDNTALIAQEATTRSTADSALAGTISLIGAQTPDGQAFILNTQTVYVDANESWANWETTLQTGIDSKATITQWQEVKDSTDELYAKAGIALNVNNHVIGWALHNDGASGSMVIQVDKFFIVTPPGDNKPPVQIFAADATGVYIDTAFIRDLTVDILTAGTINVPIILEGSITLPASGFIRSGQLNYDSGVGWWLGHVGGSPKFSIGNSAGQKLTYADGVLTVRGRIVSEAGSDVDYGDVTGPKPPSDADNTMTVINGPIITTGRIEIGANGRIWSGKNTYASTVAGFFLGEDGTVPKFHIGSGADQYLRWTGQHLETNKLVVNGSIISNSPLDVNAARIHTGGGRTAPFVIYDVNQAGNTVDLLGFVSPGFETTYKHNAKRLAFYNQDALFQVGVRVPGDPGEQGGELSIRLQRRVNGGAWTTTHILGSVGINTGTTAPTAATFVARYTTPNSWSTLDFRVTTVALSGGGSAVLTASVFFNNANQAPAVAADTGGSSSTTPLPPSAWTPPPGTILP